MTFILLGLCVAAASGDASIPTAPGDEVQEILRRLDERIYVPHGIAALTFTYTPGSAAAPAGPVRVRHYWREGTGDRTEIIDAEGKVLDKLPGQVLPEHEKVLREHWRSTSRELRQIVVGQSFQRQYGDWRGEVVKKVKNGEELVSLVLEPPNPKRVRRVVIDLGRDGLPWRSEKEYLNRDRVELHLSFEPRESQVVLSKVQHLYTPGTPGQAGLAYAYHLTWQKVDGRLLLAAVTKEGRDLPREVAGTTEFAAMQVNDGVPAFEPDKEPPK